MSAMKVTGTSRRAERRGRGGRRAFAAAIVLAVVGLVAPAPGMVPVASAAEPQAPPVGPLVSYPASDSVEISGLAIGAPVTIEVVRGTRVIATAEGKADLTGVLLVNRQEGSDGPGAIACWDGRTPNIQGGDVIQYTAGNRTYGTTTQNLSAGRPALDKPAEDPEANIVVQGRAADPNGNSLPTSTLAVVLDNDRPFLGGDRDGNLVAGGEEPAESHGTIRFDDPTNPGHFTTTFSRVNPADYPMALRDSTQVEVHWLGRSLLAENELTIFEDKAIGGKDPFCTGEEAGGSITSLGSKLITSANVGDPLTVRGFASAMERIELSVAAPGVGLDAPSRTWRTATLTGSADDQDWDGAIPPADLRALDEGPFELTVRWVPTDTTLTPNPTTRPLTKDTIGPAAPNASRPSGTIVAPSAVASFSSAGAFQVCASLNGTVPAMNAINACNSPQIALTMVGATPAKGYRVTTVAYDEHGNPSPIATYGYTVQKPAVAEPVKKPVKKKPAKKKRRGNRR